MFYRSSNNILVYAKGWKMSTAFAPSFSSELSFVSTKHTGSSCLFSSSHHQQQNLKQYQYHEGRQRQQQQQQKFSWINNRFYSSSLSLSSSSNKNVGYIGGNDNDTSNKERKPAIAIVGAGAVGSYYGARLWECDKYDIKFHMRGENYKHCTKHGLNVTSIDGDIYIPPDKLQAYENTRDIGEVDWIIVSIKSTSLSAIPDLIFPLLNPKTKIITIMNGFIEDDLIDMLRIKTGENTTVDGDNNNNNNNNNKIQFCKAIYGGMAFVCCSRLQPGLVSHSYYGLLSGGLAATSSSSKKNENYNDYKNEFIKLFQPTKIDISYESSLLFGRWKKSIWNIPFNSISVVMGGITVDKIVNHIGLRKLAFALMDEVIQIANADLMQNVYNNTYDDNNAIAIKNDESRKEEQKQQHENFELFGNKDKEFMMKLSDEMGPYQTSTMIDYINKKPIEVQYLFREPLNRGKKLNIYAPHLETIVTQIEALTEI